MLFLLLYDPVAVWGLVVAIVGVVVGLIAAVAAIYAAVYAKAAPTRDDLARVEENTAHLEVVNEKLTRMDSRHEQQELRREAERVQVRVRGQNAADEPFLLYIVAPGKFFRPFIVYLQDDASAVYGEFNVKSAKDEEWVAVIDSESMSTWFQSRAHQDNFNKARLYISLSMSVDELLIDRHMPVTLYRVRLSEMQRDGWRIEGEV